MYNITDVTQTDGLTYPQTVTYSYQKYLTDFVNFHNKLLTIMIVINLVIKIYKYIYIKKSIKFHLFKILFQFPVSRVFSKERKAKTCNDFTVSNGHRFIKNYRRKTQNYLMLLSNKTCHIKDKIISQAVNQILPKNIYPSVNLNASSRIFGIFHMKNFNQQNTLKSSGTFLLH